MPRYLLLFLLTGVFSCTYTIKVKDGQTAYDLKQYNRAIPMLQKEMARAQSRTQKGKYAFMIGDAFRRTGKDSLALEWFRTAYDNNYGPEALKATAFQLKKMERYAEARDAFKNLGIEIGSPYEFRKELVACDVAEGWLKEEKNNGWKVSALDFNSTQNDFSPVIYADKRLVFTSDRFTASGKDAYHWTGNKFMDYFIVEPEGASPQQFDAVLNSENNEGSLCFNREFTEVYFVRTTSSAKGQDAYCRIFQANLMDNTWSTPRPLPFQKDKVNYMHPALSPDGNTLYFASDDPEGWGGFDLYQAQRNLLSENGWDEPRLLNRSINTPGNEVFPTLYKDTLYFSSDGLTGLGGLDIFKTYLTSERKFAPPYNLKTPINTGADEFGLIVAFSADKAENKPGELLKSGYFTSNRSGGRGGDDIYRFEQRVPPPLPPKKDTTPERPPVFALVLEGYVLEKIFSKPDDPNSTVLGRRPLPGAVVRIEAPNFQKEITVGEDGLFRLELKENTPYNFLAAKPEYLSNTARFSTVGIANDPRNPTQVFELEIELDKIYRDREIVLENIYYDYDKWDIRPDAEPTLNRLADVLRQNPAINIELGSHTDCRGNDNYNQSLSQKRAQSAVNYLIGQGIDAARLSARGYGESQPAADCACARCSESEHQANRRTTFRIVE